MSACKRLLDSDPSVVLAYPLAQMIDGAGRVVRDPIPEIVQKIQEEEPVKVTSVEEADRPGVKIAVPERSAPDLFLSRNLKAAEIVRVPGGPDAAIDVLRSGRGMRTLRTPTC